MADLIGTKDYGNGLNFLEELTENGHRIQEQVLEEILLRNAGTEYLTRFLHGQTDKQLFKNNVPITSNILLADPISEFIQSSGTSGGQPKLIPMTAENFEKKTLELTLVDPVVKNETLSSCYFMSDSFKKSVPKICTSPVETILCLDHKQSMYCQLLTGLLQRDHVVSISSIFGSVLARSIKFLEDYWNELCSNIRTGCLSDWITDPGCRNAVSSILTRPNPDLADTIEHICGNESWEGIIKKLWPKAKYINSVITGTMSQYISLLDFYGGGIPLVSPSYGSSESTFGVNLNPLSNPYDVSYTFLPNMAYFEFLPVDKDGEEKARESNLDGVSSQWLSEMINANGNVEHVDFTNVKLGQYYEVVVTNFTVLKLTGFHNNSLQFQFVERRNSVLSVDMDKTSEADLLKAIRNAKRHLEPLGFVLMTFSSYAETSSIPLAFFF
ncbi:hypothetical protein ES288_D05G412600v1 [Gossypium darwinii]|uniref:GH3 middle domain-containing protein n=1 Tax=Gossypium darwinii TaxID=34276 RepID=A0A5D2CSN2_GOSDA|nr:hypothetical protein ES288_D05G412600v1 [Gossypium darwinii]